MNATVADSKLDKAINEAFRRLRDVSLRDGIQSWDGNKWPIDEIVPIAHELNELARIGKKRGIDMPPAEVWGGGQVVQPALFMGEDPLKNLDALNAAMPDVPMQLLYRGRQGFGFEPISEKIQEKAIEAAAGRGVKVFRIFDMMNDVENVKPGFEAMNAYKEKHGRDSIVIEGAISYISPPEQGGIAKGERAMTLKEYGQYAVELAKLGSDEIVIKNYSGVGDKEMPDLIKAIRHELDEAGYRNMKVNLHDHGQKPDVVAAAIAAGADKVDVAIGALSGGPSHTNMRSAIYHLLEEQGFDISAPTTQTAINHNPMMKQLKKVEDAIEAVVNKERPGKNGATTFKKNRAVLEKFTQEDADRYHVASGALSDLTGRIEDFYSKAAKGGGMGAGFPDQDTFFKQVLETGVDLWEKAGQFNTVTPGAKILVDQAIAITLFKLAGKKVTLDMYQDPFVDIAAGRFGKNRGMEKGLGDTQWLDTMKMYRALKLVNEGLRDGQISDKDLGLFALDASMGADGHGNRLVLESSKGKKQFNLRDPDLETKLGKSDIGKFADAVQKSGFNASIKERILTALSSGRFNDPTKGMEEGNKLVSDLERQGTDITAMHKAGCRISSPEDVALLSILMPSGAFTKMLSTVMNEGPVQDTDAAKGGIKSHVAAAAARSGDGKAAGKYH